MDAHATLTRGEIDGLLDRLVRGLTGLAADYFGLHRALALVSFLPLIGWLLARTLPETK